MYLPDGGQVSKEAPAEKRGFCFNVRCYKIKRTEAQAGFKGLSREIPAGIFHRSLPHEIF